MAGHRSPEEIIRERYAKWNDLKFRYFDIIVSSGVIRREFFRRCKDLNLDPIRLAEKHGIVGSTFEKNYIKNDVPECTRSFSQEHFLKMLESIGIDIKVIVSLKPLEDTYRKLKEDKIITNGHKRRTEDSNTFD